MPITNQKLTGSEKNHFSWLNHSILYVTMPQVFKKILFCFVLFFIIISLLLNFYSMQCFEIAHGIISSNPGFKSS